MRLYNSLIRELNEMIAPYKKKIWLYDEALAWPENEENRFILRSNAAFELGSDRIGIGCLFPTQSEEYFLKDRILLIGEDIKALSENSDYARITLAKIRNSESDENKIYHQIKDLDYTKFKVFPDGFMLRFSTQSQTEGALIRKDTFHSGISFQHIGMNFITHYKTHPNVEHITQIFITDPSFEYKKLAELAKKSEEITSALNHILTDLSSDCGKCDFRTICDEVEGMRETHLKKIPLQ